MRNEKRDDRLSSAASRGRLRTHPARPAPARLAMLPKAMKDTGTAYEAWGRHLHGEGVRWRALRRKSQTRRHCGLRALHSG